jgi:hypothetical protein
MTHTLKITKNLKNHWWWSVSHRKLHWRRRKRWGITWDDEVTPTPSKSSAHSKRRLSTHWRHLPIAFPSWNRALLRHSDPFSMMPLRKPSGSEGFLTETRQVFPHLVQWSFLWDTHQYLVFIVLPSTPVYKCHQMSVSRLFWLFLSNPPSLRTDFLAKPIIPKSSWRDESNGVQFTMGAHRCLLETY